MFEYTEDRSFVSGTERYVHSIHTTFDQFTIWFHFHWKSHRKLSGIMLSHTNTQNAIDSCFTKKKNFQFNSIESLIEHLNYRNPHTEHMCVNFGD